MVDEFITEYANINKGVPQGTVICPFLFSLIVGDIKPKQLEINKLIKFADDMTVSAPVRSKKDHSMEEMKYIENWAARNRMTLNLSKTWKMLLSGGTSKPPPGPINGVKLLGVTFEDDVCCWELQVDDLFSKAGSRMYVLRVCKRYGYQKEHSSYLFDTIILSLFCTVLKFGVHHCKRNT